ncbi:MAG TPA: ATP-grasp domain-containing protein [Allosphingosinicella sp.]|jgi:protein-tyrosine-phosphatase/predicted ATP-grasp superfamily ATP-dependent carboligase|nr:ATP-grasp domain-containing protein [Allosphingosinicella sp.]
MALRVMVEKPVSERVLLFGDDTKAFLAVARSLGRKGVEVHAAPSDLASPALKSRFVAASHRLPPYALGPEAWADAVAALADRERFALILPTSDASLLMLMHHADRIGRSRLAIPNPEAAAAFTDKAETRRLAFAHGVPVCAGRLLTRDEEADDLVRSFGLPLVLKPRRSWDPDAVEGKRSARIVRSVEAVESALAGGLADDWIVESFFRGVGVGVSVLASEGEITTAIQHRRLNEENETGPSTRRTSEPLDPRLLGWVRELARATRLTGVAMFEFRWEPGKGRHVLLEVNPRFWGSLPLAVAAGADFPALLYDLHCARPQPPHFDYRHGLIKADLTGEYRRLAGRFELAPSPAARAAAAAAGIAYLPRLIRPAAFDSWAKDDPRPFSEERREVLGRFKAAALKRLPRPAMLRHARAREHLRRLAGTHGDEGVRLLLVGDANVCRSPFAEQLLRLQMGSGAGRIEIESAGMRALADRPPSEAAMEAAAEFGVDLSDHRSRSLTPGVLLSASAVIVFDYKTADRLCSLRPDMEALVLPLPDLLDARDIRDASSAGLASVSAEFRRISASVSALAGALTQPPSAQRA